MNSGSFYAIKVEHRQTTSPMQVLSTCASSTFASRLLRTHGLKQDEPHLVYSESNHRRFHLVRFPRMVGVCGRRGPPTLGSASVQSASWGLPSDFPTIESLVDEADRKLSTSQNHTHVLRHLFTVKRTPNALPTSKGS